MPQGVSLKAISRIDRNGNVYYFTCPKLPILVDLSRAVVFVHPSPEQDEADIVIKPYQRGGDDSSDE